MRWLVQNLSVKSHMMANAGTWGESRGHNHPYGWIKPHRRQRLKAPIVMGEEQMMDMKNKTIQIFTKKWTENSTLIKK